MYREVTTNLRKRDILKYLKIKAETWEENIIIVNDRLIHVLFSIKCINVKN